MTTSSFSLLLIYRPRKDERLSWPSWLTYSGRLTNIRGHPVSCRSSAGQGKLADQRPTFYRCATQPTVPESRCPLSNCAVSRLTFGVFTVVCRCAGGYAGVRCQDRAIYSFESLLGGNCSFILFVFLCVKLNNNYTECRRIKYEAKRK